MTENPKRSQKKMSKTDRLQLIGLLTIARTKGQELESIKETFLKLLHNPYLGEDEFWDMVWNSRNLVEMLDKSLKTRMKVKELGKR